MAKPFPFTDDQLWTMCETFEGKEFVKWTNNRSLDATPIYNNENCYGYDLPGGVHSSSYIEKLGLTTNKSDFVDWVEGYVKDHTSGWVKFREAIRGERNGGITWGVISGSIPNDDPYWGRWLKIYRDALTKAWNLDRIQAIEDLAEALAWCHSSGWHRGNGGQAKAPDSRELRTAKAAINSPKKFMAPSWGGGSVTTSGESDQLRIGPKYTNEPLTVGIRNWVQILTKYVYTGGDPSLESSAFGGLRSESERWVDIAYNFRTLVGYKGEGGKPIIGGILYRSADPDRATGKNKDEFIQLIKNEGINAIVNLTGADHPNKTKPSWASGMDWDIFKVPSNGKGDASEYKRALEWIGDKLNNNKKVLFHCHEGLNRTGKLASHILSICGVSAEDQFNEQMFNKEHVTETSKKFHHRSDQNWDGYRGGKKTIKDYGDCGVSDTTKQYIKSALLQNRSALGTFISNRILSSGAKVNGGGATVVFVGDSWFDPGGRRQLENQRDSIITNKLKSKGISNVIINHCNHPQKTVRWGYRWDNSNTLFKNAMTYNPKYIVCDFGINDTSGAAVTSNMDKKAMENKISKELKPTIYRYMDSVKRMIGTTKVICWGILPYDTSCEGKSTTDIKGKQDLKRDRSRLYNELLSQKCGQLGWTYIDPGYNYNVANSGYKEYCLTRGEYHLQGDNWANWVCAMIDKTFT